MAASGVDCGRHDVGVVLGLTGPLLSSAHVGHLEVAGDALSIEPDSEQLLLVLGG